MNFVVLYQSNRNHVSLYLFNICCSFCWSLFSLPFFFFHFYLFIIYHSSTSSLIQSFFSTFLPFRHAYALIAVHLYRRDLVGACLILETYTLQTADCSNTNTLRMIERYSTSHGSIVVDWMSLFISLLKQLHLREMCIYASLILNYQYLPPVKSFVIV